MVLNTIVPRASFLYLITQTLAFPEFFIKSLLDFVGVTVFKLVIKLNLSPNKQQNLAQLFIHRQSTGTLLVLLQLIERLSDILLWELTSK